MFVNNIKKFILLLTNKMPEVVGYCVKCKEKRNIKNGEVVTMKGGKRKAYTGECIKCGTKIYKILSKEDAEKLEKKK